MLAMTLAHRHAGSVLPLQLRSKGVSSAGRGKRQTGVPRQALLGERALFLQ